MKKQNMKNQTEIQNILSLQLKKNSKFSKKRRDKKLEENRQGNIVKLLQQNNKQADKQKTISVKRNYEIKNEINITYQEHKDKSLIIKDHREQQPVVSLIYNNNNQQPTNQEQNRLFNQNKSKNSTQLLSQEQSQNMSLYLNFQYSKFLKENEDIKKCFYQLILEKEGVDMFAIKNEQKRFEIEEILRIILKDSCLNQFYQKINSVLIKAVQKKKLKEVETLLQYNFNPNLQDYQGQTSLHHACLANQDDMVNLLLKYSADLNIQTFLGQTVLHIACQENKLKIVKILLSKEVDVNQVDNNLHTPLMLVCYGGKKYKQQYHDIVFNQSHPFENIISLVMNNIPEIDSFIQIAKLLINKGADINQVDQERNTSLMIACQHRNYQLANLLISQGAQINVQNDQQQTAFMISCIKRDKKMQKLLIDYNADLEIYNKDGLTGFLYLCILGSSEDVQFLLDQNVNIHQKSLDQKLGYTLAKENQNIATLRVIKNHYLKLIYLQQRQVIESQHYYFKSICLKEQIKYLYFFLILLKFLKKINLNL